jgi:23S rRNA (adenine2503-C2)-methyltransferase
MPKAITNLTFQEIEKLISSLGEPAYRARQLLTWLYRGLAISYDEMTDLPLSFRQRMAEGFVLHSLIPLREVKSKDGTVKTLFRLGDGKTVESALMLFAAGEGRARTTICLSTQVGCSICCPFCATGQQGFERNLTSGEMIDQVLYFARRLSDSNEGNGKRGSHVTNLVFMGMGEPLANYESLRQTIEMLNSPQGLGIGARNITISTAGLVPQIKRLSKEKLQVGLAVSLHASDNVLRNRLVPLNKRYPLEELIPACREYFEKTGRRVTFEYVLFEGINDSLVQARALADLLTGMNCHVNLIAANRTSDREFRPSSHSAILAFERELQQHGIDCTLRVSRGQDIDAGCGQLRGRTVSDNL